MNILFEFGVIFIIYNEYIFKCPEIFYVYEEETLSDIKLSRGVLALFSNLFEFEFSGN